MNKSYKSVWNESTGSWVAVSELATGRSKSKRAKTAISKAILTQIAVGGMSLAGASVAMAGDPVKFGTGATVGVADGIAIGTGAEAAVDPDQKNAGKTGGIAIGEAAYDQQREQPDPVARPGDQHHGWWWSGNAERSSVRHCCT
jgi:hypothetical protein